MGFTEGLKQWLKKKSTKIVVVLFLIISIIFLINGNTSQETETITKKSIVTLTTPVEYVGLQSLSVIGTVRALSEAKITSEVSGRVTSVNANLGQQVPAGKVLVTLENASQQASVLQAEGIYEAALAAAAQNDIGVNESENALTAAQNNAVSTFKSAYNTVNGIVINSIDDFFANPDRQVPGLRIDGRGFTYDLNSSRVALQTTLLTWQGQVNTISVQSNLEDELEYATKNIKEVVDIIDTFLIVFNQQDNSSRYTDDELNDFSTSFTTLRSTLINTQSTIDAAKTALSTAKDAVKRAELLASGGVTSTTDAQVKQALGALRAAQANYAKTILSTPVSGTVNSISVRVGDFINAYSEVAVVANNNVLEIVTYISDSEKDLIKKGDVVSIENKYDGVVMEIAPAVNSVTGKTEVRITTEGTEISNGDTVRITKNIDAEIQNNDTVKIPLTAIKFNQEDGSVFTVSDGVLVAKPVILGNIRGSSVEILEGISSTTEFVVDARGLVAGDEVETIK